MAPADPRSPIDLERRTDEQIAHALACGALQPLSTRVETVEDAGVRFVVHVLGRIERKLDETARQRRSNANPFLPPDPDLVVADVSSSHVCVLNKFNVIDRHLLIVTREFEDQQSLLGPGDFEALAWCMARFEGLGFYNAGRIAGASQPHKHLQLVGTPLGAGPLPTPVDELIRELPRGADRCPGLAYRHRLARLEGGVAGPEAAARLLNTYLALREALGLAEAAPYNLLVTSRWMMLVPRRAEHSGGISVNALGFAGSLLVRDRDQLATLRPMATLAEVS